MTPNKKIYFASDFHLGVPNPQQSIIREKQVVAWLDSIKYDAEAIFLMGDLFDFWFEYKYTVPKGYVRLLGKLAELADADIALHIFTGNHDMWLFDYLPQQFACTIYRKPITREFAGKKFYLGHGDGLGPGDKGYKFIKKIFASATCQWLFARIHPNLGIGIGNYWSGKSRLANGPTDKVFKGEEKEWLVIYCKEVLQQQHYDYFIFGHRHLPLDIQLNNNSRYINLGEWVNYNTYAVFDGDNLELKEFNKLLTT